MLESLNHYKKKGKKYNCWNNFGKVLDKISIIFYKGALLPFRSI
jgi:hypothetical protein